MAEKAKKNTHVFSLRKVTSFHVGAERRTSNFFPPVMRRWLFGVSLRACGPRRRPRSRCLKSLLSTPGWRVYLLSKKFEEILGSFLCFVCAFRFLFIFFIKWDITVILQLRRGSKFGRLFERKSDAVEFPFVIWTPTNRIKKRRSSLDDAYRHYPPFVDQNTTEGTLRSCGVSYTEIFLAVSQTILSNIFVGAWLWAQS